MFKSVRIQNFRQFKDLELKNLGRINLITGQNNTGKTSLLEALFLLDNPLDPARTTILARFRGMGQISSQSPEHWDWLFYNGDSATPIKITENRGDQVRRSLSIRLSNEGLIPAVKHEAETNGRPGTLSVATTEPLPVLMYESSDENGERADTKYQWTSQGLVVITEQQRSRREGFFLPDFHRVAQSDVVRVSQLEANGREAELASALRVVEPRLKQLRVLDLGDGARIYGDLGQRPFVPVSMMGSGIARVLTIVSAIVLRESPVMFVDEIADGLHYSVMPSVWKAIIAAAHKHDVQIFATTHSYECIEAAVAASVGVDGGLAMFRLARVDDRIRVVDVDDEGLRDAVSLGFEMR